MDYKGFTAVFHFDEKSELFVGRVSNTKDLITFQGKSMETLDLSFMEAVNDYLAWCKKMGKVWEHEKPSQQNQID